MTDITTQSAVTETSSDERLLALLSHLSIILGGIILPIIIWATQKDKSKFVRFHSLQAIWFHVVYVVLMVLLAIVLVSVILITGFSAGAFNEQNSDMPVAMIVSMFLFYAFFFLIIFIGIGYSIYVGVKAYKGVVYRIPVIGNIIYKKVYGQS